MKFHYALSLAFLSSLAVSACVSSSTDVTPSRPEIKLAPKGKTFTEWNEFILDSGDVVNLVVEELPQVNGVQKISPSGLLALPVIGTVRAKGLTEVQLREAIHLKVRPHVKIPRVSVSLVQMNSYVVYFEGKVAKPGTVKLETRTTLGQGIALVGGVKGEGLTKVTVVRDTADGTRKRFESPIEGLKNGLMDNYVLERGDLIILD